MFKILRRLWRNQRIQCQSHRLPGMGWIPQRQVLMLLITFSSKTDSRSPVGEIEPQPKAGREHIISSRSLRQDLPGFAWAKVWEPVSRGEKSRAPTRWVVASPSCPVPRALPALVCRGLLCKRAVPAHPELLGSLPCPELLSPATQPLRSRHPFSARPIYKTPLPKTCFGRHELASHHQLQQPSCTARRCSTWKKWSRASNNLTLSSSSRAATSDHALQVREKAYASPSWSSCKC